MTASVDAWIVAHVPEAHRPVVERLRALLRDCAPNAEEAIRYDMICWTGRKLFAYLTASEKDVTLGFVHGTLLRDDDHLLRGRGKGTRHVKVKRLDAIPEAAIRDYVAQELALDLA
jgi:hypothetical protein